MDTITLEHINAVPKQTFNYLRVNDISVKVDAPQHAATCAQSCHKELCPSGVGSQASAYLDSVAQKSQTIHVDANAQDAEVYLDVDALMPVLSTDILVHTGANLTIYLSAQERKTQGITMGHNVHIVAEDNARISLVSTVHTAQEATYIENIGIQLAHNCELTTSQYVLQAGTSVCGMAIDVRGDNSHFSCKTRYLSEHKQLLDMNIVANIYGQKSSGTIDASGVLKDKAKKRLAMTIDLKKGCKFSGGSEAERVLLLGDSIQNKTLPVILCHEDEVFANHGATIGSISAEQLDYLKTRGLTEDEIAKLFAQSIIEDAQTATPTHSKGHLIAEMLLEQGNYEQ